MTYTVCKKLIEIKEFTQEEAAELQSKLDVFLLHDRIVQAEYEDLMVLLLARVTA